MAPKVWFFVCKHCGVRNASEVSPDMQGGRYCTVVCRRCRGSQIQVASSRELAPDRRKESRGKAKGFDRLR